MGCDIHMYLEVKNNNGQWVNPLLRNCATGFFRIILDDSWDGDGHNHSWCTLKELIEFSDRNKTTKYSGMVSPKQAVELEKGCMPNSWCQGTSDKSHVWREWESPDKTLDPLIKAIKGQLSRLSLWVEQDKPENVRIVFWFDN